MSDALAEVEATFEFLESELGFTRDGQRRANGGFEVRYAKDDVGVLVDWYPRDPLTVWLVRLVDGGFPPKGKTEIRADSTLHYFDLGDLETVAGCPETDQRSLNAPSAENARVLASSLRTCGESLLSGDTRQFDELQEHVKRRAREVTISHYGQEYARSLGW
ncbi:hypothetical protein O7635_09145 [Asanoa sp. WMMD1127]|uniref:hypothetical protein n=1 Tax=Asanoa sp. WMMD1127 TaxID=3016107 RepID=UPI0024178458|nr:hypothetical protein [Asanoa sp. WMMD1127]MDG4822019.1 hypothetical protein [Asanoa sp. WMMD1127]